MMKYLILIICLALGAPVFAAEATGNITWQPPTEFVDGTPLNPATDLSSYTIYVGNASRDYNIAAIVVGVDGSNSESVTVDIPGTFADGETINLYLAMTATDNNNETSAYSAEVLKTFVVSIENVAPNPPVLIDASFTIICQAVSAGVTCSITPTN